MANRTYFSKVEDENLIELVKLKPALYNIRLKGYKDLTLKENIWKDIAKNINKTATECKTRWKSLRDYFMRKKRELKKPTGSAASFIKLDPRYESLMFLNSIGLERSASKEPAQELETPEKFLTSPSMEIEGDLIDDIENIRTENELDEDINALEQLPISEKHLSRAEINELNEDLQTMEQLPISIQSLNKTSSQKKKNK